MKLDIYCLGLAWATLTGFASGHTSSPNHVLHERRSGKAVEFRKGYAEGGAVLTFHIALKQSSLDNAHDLLTDISSPVSPNYGKLWTPEQVQEMFRPSRTAVDVVQSWLHRAGIENVNHSHGWLSFNTTVARAEELMYSTYHEHVNLHSGDIKIGCDEYHLPQDVSEHVDYITPGIALSAPLQKTTAFAERGLADRRASAERQCSLGIVSNGPTPVHNISLHSLEHCGKHMTPACIRALYNLPYPDELASSYNSTSANALGVYAFSGSYCQANLDQFFHDFAPDIPKGTHPQFAPINGAHLVEHKLENSEVELDLEMAYGLTYPQEVTLYSVKPEYKDDQAQISHVFKSFPLAFSDFFAAIDSSFCGKGHTSPDQECGIYAIPEVLSISYGTPEITIPEAMQRRQCMEFLKLGLQGTTVTVASGDYGVGSSLGFQLHFNGSGCLRPGEQNHPVHSLDQNGTVFSPYFPASCPYVLTVGGTQLKADQTVGDAETAMHLPGIYAPSIRNTVWQFSSGGGFSNTFPRPSYQYTTVTSYLTHDPPPYPSYNHTLSPLGSGGGIYNIAGRAFPDVSANAAHFAASGAGQPYSGTSVSTPLWASIITLINSRRRQVGKRPVGFVNEVLYRHPEVLEDVVGGRNPGCFTNGFEAVRGWDPVTGLGTPRFEKLLHLFLGLP